MGLFDNGWKGNILGGLAIGIGSAVLGPIVIPILSRTAKPLAKAAIKGGLLMYEKGKEKVAEAQEVVEDLLAEARSELDEEAAARSEPPKAGTGTGGVMVPEARIVHRIAGRMRVRVPSRRGDPAYFATVEETLRSLNGVERVEADPLTGGILILHAHRSGGNRRLCGAEGAFPGKGRGSQKGGRHGPA